MHAVEYAWLERMRTVRLYAYRLPAGPFRPFVEPEPARVMAAPELSRLWTLWEAVSASSLSFSGIRLRNARPSR